MALKAFIYSKLINRLEEIEVWNKITKHRLFLFRVIALMVIVLLLALIFIWLDTRNSSQLKFDSAVADSWSKFAIGFGAVATGFGGLGLIEDWLKKQSSRDNLRESLIRKWSKLYPREKYNTDYRLIQNREAQGVVYIQDLPDGAKHWIANPETLQDLGFDYSMIEMIDDEPFKSIPSSENINTRLADY